MAKTLFYLVITRASDMVEDVELETTFPSTTSSTTVMILVLAVELEVVLTL